MDQICRRTSLGMLNQTTFYSWIQRAAKATKARRSRATTPTNRGSHSPTPAQQIELPGAHSSNPGPSLQRPGMISKHTVPIAHDISQHPQRQSTPSPSHSNTHSRYYSTESKTSETMPGNPIPRAVPTVAPMQEPSVPSPNVSSKKRLHSNTHHIAHRSKPGRATEAKATPLPRHRNAQACHPHLEELLVVKVTWTAGIQGRQIKACRASLSALAPQEKGRRAARPHPDGLQQEHRTGSIRSTVSERYGRCVSVP